MFPAGNWVDLVIFLVLVFFIAEGLSVGFWVILTDFLSFLFSLLFALKNYSIISDFLQSELGMGRSLSNAGGFLIIAILSEVLLGYILTKMHKRLPEKLRKNKLVKPAAILPALGETFVIASFFITLLITFPISPGLKSAVGRSIFGGFVIRETTVLESKLSNIFGGVAESTLSHLVVKPGSKERISLNVESEDIRVDREAEGDLFGLVNNERNNIGASALDLKAELVPVARGHAKDMWERGYFGHITPDGDDVGNRLNEAQVGFVIAGENLALAPTTEVAHTGLMNSEGHRKNILSPEFENIGVGVIDNGIFGKMFVQVFTD